MEVLQRINKWQGGIIWYALGAVIFGAVLGILWGKYGACIPCHLGKYEWFRTLNNWFMTKGW